MPTITLVFLSYTLAWRLKLANLDGMQRPGLSPWNEVLVLLIQLSNGVRHIPLHGSPTPGYIR